MNLIDEMMIKKDGLSTDFSFKKSQSVKELRWIWNYIKKYLRFTAGFSVVGVFGIFMSLGSSIITKYLVDAVTGYDRTSLGMLAGLLLAMGSLTIVINALISRASALVSTKIYNEIQMDVYKKIINADWQSLAQYRNGDMMNRLSWDVKTVSDSVFGLLSSLVTKSVQFLGAVAIIFYYDPLMAVVALICTPISALASRVLIKKTKKYNMELRKVNSKVMTYQEESFQNLQTIKAFGITDHFEKGMEKVQREYKKSTLDLNKYSVITTGAMSFMGMIVSYICLGFSIYRLWQGTIIFGTFTLFLQLTSRVTSSFSSLISLVPSLISAATAAGRIMNLSELEQEKELDDERVSEIIDDWKQNKNSISVKVNNLSFSYEYSEENKVIDNLTLTLNKATSVAIVGPSGKGKTTFFRLLLGLLKPTSGSIELVSDTGKSCRVSRVSRELFSYVPQGNTIFAETIADNMRMICESASDEDIIEALKTACAWDFVKTMPKGINSLIGEKGTGLSEGQAQRIAIARALLRDAPILLLDEATSALDLETEKKIVENIMRMKKLCIITTHRDSLKQVCDYRYEV